jgi:arsenate reductase
VHNSARSQLAEEYLRALAGDRFLVTSAGITPGNLNPYVVEVLGQEGIDISQKAT